MSSDVADPGLSKGWAYIVNEVPYKAYLRDYKGKPEVCLEFESDLYLDVSLLILYSQTSTCTAHKAVNDAETRQSDGLAATGLGTCDCARHDFKRPIAVGDLQKGERYVRN